ncbi:hypothetical protein Pint_28970 [Pistacia integerrima]|uniref:Uncharacterized protein n=1 Tax=Pistacia integerrima TaxID=434235 RepID=A0ACC0X411_9ROSI|nr:hypothetical protein Pint_28970 [Pistacia integerrima]
MRTVMSFKKRELAGKLPELENVTINEESMSFKKRELAGKLPELENVTINEESMSFKSRKLVKLNLDFSTNHQLIMDNKAKTGHHHDRLDTAATKLQKFHKSYRTDCAVVIEALWWKEMEYAALRRSSVSFFTADHKSETAVSKWERARIRAAKIGKGLSKNEKAQKLVLIHWLEAIDPRHRYGGNLHPYYDVWMESESNQPFFYWLDIGDGKDVSTEKCSRTNLQHQCIKYLGPKEREAYEVVMENGKLVYKQSRVFVDTPKGSQWIFVLGTSMDFYVGEKKKGFFQHSSFLAGGTTMASGRLVAHSGILEAIWPLSGHYRPTEEHFKEFCNFLEDHRIDLTNVKKVSIDEYIPPKVTEDKKPIKSEEPAVLTLESTDEPKKQGNKLKKEEESMKVQEESAAGLEESIKKPLLLQKWSKGGGPKELQHHGVEQVLNLSPRPVKSARPFVISCGLVASPRPGSKIQFPPSTLACLGLPNPIHFSNSKVIREVIRAD